jgi:hypothetical protein
MHIEINRMKERRDCSINTLYLTRILLHCVIHNSASTSPTVHRSRVDPRKECESCGNARFRERKFVSIQRKNIRPSNKEMNKAVTMLKLPDVFG